MSEGPDSIFDGAWKLNARNCPGGGGPQVLEGLSALIYDPSNGTISRGDIARLGGDVPSAVLVNTE